MLSRQQMPELSRAPARVEIPQLDDLADHLRRRLERRLVRPTRIVDQAVDAPWP